MRRISNDPDSIHVLCDHMSSGGSVIELCEAWGVHYHQVTRWVNSSPHLRAMYEQAKDDRKEWVRERALLELRRIGTLDIRDAFDESGRLRPPSEWPDGLAASISSVESEEIIDRKGELQGFSKKIKVWDKLKALDQQVRVMGIYTERVNVAVDSLESILSRANVIEAEIVEPNHDSKSDNSTALVDSDVVADQTEYAEFSEKEKETE